MVKTLPLNSTCTVIEKASHVYTEVFAVQVNDVKVYWAIMRESICHAHCKPAQHPLRCHYPTVLDANGYGTIAPLERIE